jgi:hypothetical protein
MKNRTPCASGLIIRISLHIRPCLFLLVTPPDLSCYNILAKKFTRKLFVRCDRVKINKCDGAKQLALHLSNNDLAENLFNVQPAPNLQTIRTSLFELLACFCLCVALESQIIYFIV